MTETVAAPLGWPDASLPLREGDEIAGKYRVGAILGRGGVGVVIAATHLLLQQRVAVKLLLKPSSPDMVGRFLREGQAAARLKGEHVARVLDMGQLPNGAPYMVMEYLEGRDLGAELELRGPLPIDEAVEYVLHACEAMAEAHAAGIVHRDLKPANLFLASAADGTRRVKVVDFGISKDFDGPNDHRLTSTTTVIGSPLYMSPEQMRSARDTDARSDIWALGVILFELLTAQPPFDAELYSDLVIKVATRSPPPPSALRRDLPPRLEAAILRCLEKDPDRRFPDVGQLAAALVPFAPPSGRAALDRIWRLLDAATASRASVMPGRALGQSRPSIHAGAPQPRAESVAAMTGQSAGTPRGLLLAVALTAAGAIALTVATMLLLQRRDAPVVATVVAPSVEPPAPVRAPASAAAAPVVEPREPAAGAGTGEAPAQAPPSAALPAPRLPSSAQAATKPRAAALGAPTRGTAASPAPAEAPAATAARNPLDLGIK